MSDEKTVYISTQEIEDYLFRKLIEKGLAPNNEDLEALSNIFFDFLAAKELMEEE